MDIALTIGGWIGWLLLTVYAKTCRVKVVTGHETLDSVRDGQHPVLVAFWHDQLPLLASFLYFRLHRAGRPLTVLSSESRDGELAVRILSHWKMYPVRGSSTRGGQQGLRRLYRQMQKEGVSPVIIPDGPTGPPHRAKHGLTALAAWSGRPIFLVAAAGRPVHHIASWDRMAVPWPFARIEIAAKVIESAELSSAPPEEQPALIEAHLKQLIEQLRP